uniref:MAM domain-containing protein n=1 Tax=Amphiprion percula TaxID=161767 RepID=A0A3P8UAG2_AMPPE
MLDDIMFENCGEEDIPAGSDHLSCDFEKDTCSWYHDYTATLLWKMTDGKYEELPGNGNYMIITTDNLKTSSAARLLSFPQPAGHVLCVSFWYRIFGSSIGTCSLKFIAKHSGEPQTVMWMRSGTQGSKWRFTFFSFIIEAELDGGQGSIAIDDIVVSNSESGSCPPERECTFQGSLCGLKFHPSADFSWNRTTGASQPANSSGPATDHTLGTEQGYYLSAQSWSHPVGSRGAMMTAVMEPTPPDGECLMFWYYMEGSGVGELSVYLQSPESHRNQLWTRRGDQGKHWRHGRVTLYSPDTPYQVVFRAVHLNGTNSAVKIDDFSVREGPCSPPGSCDFESGQCTWVNIPTGDGHDWVLAHGGSHGPPTDHTIQTPEGMTLDILKVYTIVQKLGVTQTISYKKDLHVLLKENSRTTTLWWLSGNHGDLWKRGEVTVGRVTQDFSVLFEASRTFNHPGHIAIDDVDFTNCTLPGRPSDQPVSFIYLLFSS